MPSEGQERWLDVVEVPRVVDPEGRYVISHDSVEICSGLSRGSYLWKVKEGGWR